MHGEVAMNIRLRERSEKELEEIILAGKEMQDVWARAEKEWEEKLIVEVEKSRELEDIVEELQKELELVKDNN